MEIIYEHSGYTKWLKETGFYEPVV